MSEEEGKSKRAAAGEAWRPVVRAMHADPDGVWNRGRVNSVLGVLMDVDACKRNGHAISMMIDRKALIREPGSDQRGPGEKFKLAERMKQPSVLDKATLPDLSGVDELLPLRQENAALAAEVQQLRGEIEVLTTANAGLRQRLQTQAAAPSKAERLPTLIPIGDHAGEPIRGAAIRDLEWAKSYAKKHGQTDYVQAYDEEIDRQLAEEEARKKGGSPTR